VCGMYQLASGPGGLEPEESKSRKSQTNPGQTILHHPDPLLGPTACLFSSSKSQLCFSWTTLRVDTPFAFEFIKHVFMDSNTELAVLFVRSRIARRGTRFRSKRQIGCECASTGWRALIPNGAEKLRPIRSGRAIRLRRDTAYALLRIGLRRVLTKLSCSCS
jgi:hypothetical protein